MTVLLCGLKGNGSGVGAERLSAVWDELNSEGEEEELDNASSEEDVSGPVKIHRSLTRDLLDNDIDAWRVKECVSKDERRDRICRRESVANVSSWNPTYMTDVSKQQCKEKKSPHICTL